MMCSTQDSSAIAGLVARGCSPRGKMEGTIAIVRWVVGVHGGGMEKLCVLAVVALFLPCLYIFTA